MDKFILDKINDKPAAFFKHFQTEWFNPLIYSVLFKDWYIREEGYRIEDIFQAAKYYPSIICEISKFVVVLEEKYSDSKYDYKNETYVSAAIKLHKKYKERLENYLMKKIPEYGLDQIYDDLCPEQVFREMVYRGYIPFDMLKAQPKAYYIITHNTNSSINLIFPKYFDTLEKAQEGQTQFGISRITEIKQYP